MNNLDKIITETIHNYIHKIISESNSLLNEAYTNLPFREFDKDMKIMGFKVRKGDGDRLIYRLDNCVVTVHKVDPARGDMLRNTVNELQKSGKFKDKRFWERFPWKKWQINSDAYADFDNTDDEIEIANKKYQDADVYPVFPHDKNSVCVLEYDDKANLCRSKNDRRPIYDTWFDRFSYDRNTGKPKLSVDNYDTMETYSYIINNNGTIDFDNIVIENKKYGKNRNFV